jgi:plastocyanin
MGGGHAAKLMYKIRMLHRVPVTAAFAAALALVPARPPAASPQAGTGTIAGKVTVTKMRRPPLPTAAYGRRDVPKRSTHSTPETRNVVIYVSGLKPSASPSPMRAEIVQRDEQFVPQLTAVTVGSTVDFPNQDPFFHNVFSLSRAATFDLGRYRSGTSKSQVLDTPGVVKVFCHLHSQMSAVIMVLDHGWFTIPADDGTFTIRDIPAGERTVVAWHERIGDRKDKVRIAPGGTTRISFTLPVLEPNQ